MKNLSPAELAVVAAVDRDRVAEDLAALVAIPSLTGDEGEVQTEAALRMTTAGLDVERIDTPAIELAADPDFPGVEVARDSHPVVIGRLGDGDAGRRVLIAGHIDVVAPGDELAWTSPPFEPRIADGKLYGRGACDMKGGVVAGLAALRAIGESEVELGGEAMLVTVPGEEDGGAGMLAAIRAGATADAAVITEPTRLELVTSQAGAITFTLTVPGQSAHAAFRRRGVSAVEKLVPVLEALAANERERNGAEPMQAMRDLGLPYPTSIGRVSAGEWSSIVPERLVAEGRFGVMIGQTPAEAEAELRAVVAEACARDEWLRDHPVDVQITGGRFASASVPSDHPLPWALGEAARDVLGRLPPFVGVPYGSDARLLINQGETPTVLYGAGDPELAHTVDEHIALEDLVRAARVLAVWAMRALAPA
jgi:acetylornithine deacetylase